MKDFLNYLPAGIPIRVVTLVCILFAGLLGVADHFTGYELSFSIFYLLPVAAASWYGNHRTGFIVSIFSGVVWLIVDVTAGHQYQSELILMWNSMVRFGFFIIVASLISTLRQNLLRERENARIDQLTGVRNMNGFIQEADALWELARRHNHSTTVGYIDLDNFKDVNDSSGHAEGDNLLKAVASTMKASIRSTDVLGRLGGDEFAALLPETGTDGAERVFSKTREALQKLAEDHHWPVTVSIGVTVINPPYPSLQEALRKADELMYCIKRDGKNGILIQEWNSTVTGRAETPSGSA